MASLKSTADKLDIDKLKKIQRNSRNLKSKGDKLDINKLVHAPVDLSKLSDAVKNDVVKKDVYNAKIKNIEDKIPDATNVKIPNNSTLATTAALTVAENK